MKKIAAWSFLLCLLALKSMAADLPWTSPDHYRVLLKVNPRGVKRSNSPATVDIDFAKELAKRDGTGVFDESTVEVVAYDSTGKPVVYEASRPKEEQHLLAWWIEKYYGITKVTLHFVVPSETVTDYAVYFDTLKSGLGKPKRYPGIVGDGDLFTEGYGRREINASKFDCFCDFDGDGDLDLFKGGVEPFVHCYENVGGSRFVYRGRLTSGGKVLTMPCDEKDDGRGWMTVAFCDWDEDGDQDFFPCMGDGPQAGQVLIYENTTVPGGLLTFTERGPLLTQQGKPIGGRFVTVTFVDWDGDGKKDVIATGHASPMFHRNIGSRKDLQHIQLAEGVPILAAGKEFPFSPSQIDVVDIDNDGDLDLFAADRGGPIYLFKNIGTRTKPVLAAGTAVAYTDKYMIGDAHTGVKAADFDGDGKIDFVGGRFWERTPLYQANQPRYYGGLFKNIGAAQSPRFEKRDAFHGSPYTERFQMCDAVRQNAVRGVDWDNDGKKDLLAGDTDGFLWYFHNQTSNRFPVFATGEKVKDGWGRILSRYTSGGHFRPEICDWNNDGKKDLILADGGGTVVLYLNVGTDDRPVLGLGQIVEAAGKPIKGPGGRCSVTVADWNNDGKKDLIFADQDIKGQGGYLFFRNVGTDAKPVLAAGRPILFKGQRVNYVRPNLGKCVDWDGDGKRDLIGCYFEVDVRFYKNIGSGAVGAEPQFADVEGVPIVHPFSVQMVSGADVIDWNGDGDLDILTGQGHGGSGLRFYERDYINDEIHHTHPRVSVIQVDAKGAR